MCILFPTGVDTSIFTASSLETRCERKPFTFLWTGLIWGRAIAENLYFVIDAMRQVAKRHKDIRLLLVGGGDYADRVRDYARTRLPPSAFEFMHWLSPDKMPEILRTVHAGLLPFSSDTLWTRSKSPTKLFEYLAAGLPVISSPVGEAKYVIQSYENGILAPDVKTFAAAMNRLITDESLYLTISRNARESAVSDYSMHTIGAQLADILHRDFNLE